LLILNIEWGVKQFVRPEDFLKTSITPVVEVEVNTLKGSAAEAFFQNAAQTPKQNSTLVGQAPRSPDTEGVTGLVIVHLTHAAD
jgi:hypothetical protein